MKESLVGLAIFASVFTVSCKDNTTPAPPAEVVAVYEIVRDYPSMDSLIQAAALADDSVEIKAFMKTVSEMPYSSDAFEAWSNSPAVKVFTPAVDSVFTDSEDIAQQLGNILARAKEHGLSIPDRRYATVVYGRMESILFVDSVMLIALNHYIGEDYDGYSHWPSYMRMRKKPSVIPYDISEALVATSYPYPVEEDKATLLSKMLYNGALVYASMKLVDRAEEGTALGYDDSTLAWLKENEKDIWNSIVSNGYLYDTSETVSDRMLAPSPHVSIVDPDSPGRVGRFIGYRIIDSYMRRHKDMPLNHLFSTEFLTSPSTLADAGYLK